MSQGTRPKTRREFMSSINEPYSNTNGNANLVYTEPKKAGMPELNRAYQIASDNPEDKDVYIGIKDIDEAVMYYFKNVLKLYVIQNNSRVEVPVIYGTPENWKSFQVDGYYRDKEGRIMAPLLVFRRQSITQNRGLGNKLDGNLIHNVQLFEKKYSKRSFYSNFNVVNNRAPEKEYAVTMTPDYVTVEYTCVVWTYFMEQMDKLIESLNFASRAYWGDPNRFLFYSSIETFTDSTTYQQGEDRAVRTNFNITLNGYLIPDSVNKKLANANKYYGLSRIIFGLEASNSKLETYEVAAKPKSTKKQLGTTVAADSMNTSITNVYAATLGSQTSEYLNINVTKKATSVSAPNIAIFSGASFAQPPEGSGLPATSISNFTFFINGQYVPNSLIILSQVSGNVQAQFNTTELGYSLESDDEVIGIGKWSS